MDKVAAIQAHIQEQTGMALQPCDYFSGEQTTGEEIYYNFLVTDRISESQEFVKLIRLAGNSSIISRVEPNGLQRVAIFLKNNS